MELKLMLTLVVTLAFSINAASSSVIYRSFSGEEFEDVQTASDENFDEPIYQPRFLPFFTDNAAVGKVADILQNPGNKTLQENLLDVVTDLALKNFGGDETLKSVIQVVKNSQNKTFQEIVMNVAAEVAISKLGNDETIRKVAEVLKNPGNKTIQESLINLATDVADSKLKGNGTLKKVAKVLQKPGNRTLQENLLNVVFEVGLSKFEDNDIIKSVSEVFKNSKNKTMQENLLNLATRVALTKFGNNPIIKMVATSLQDSGNATLNEKLSAMADAALTASLGPVQAAIIKQGIGIAGQALKVGGSLLGDTLANIGGDSPLGKAGQAISNGTQAVGGLMSSFGGGDKGVGAAIEKFGDSLRGKNVTVQEALKQAGTSISANISTVEKEKSEVVDTTVKAIDIEHNQSGTEIGSENIQQSLLESSKDETETISTKSSPTTNEQLVQNEQHSLTTKPVVKRVDKVEKTIGLDNTEESPSDEIPQEESIDKLTETDQNNSQVQFGVADSSIISIDSSSKTSDDKSIKEAKRLGGKPLNQNYLKQALPVSKEPLSLGSQATNNNAENMKITQVGNVSEAGSSVGSLYSQQHSNQGSTISKEPTAPRRQKATSNYKTNDQINQLNAVTADSSSEGNLYSQYGSMQGSTKVQESTTLERQATPINYRGSSQSETTTVVDSSTEDTYSQHGSKQESYSSSYIGSASEAIQAAREALQAGSDALGALGSLEGGSGSGSAEPITRQDRGSGSPVMSIEITRVKLNMM